MTNYESQPTNAEQTNIQTITDLLPSYYEAMGNRTTFTPIRSIPIDNHEVAWMELNGTIELDILNSGREGEPWKDWSLYCACDFTQGVGWDIYDGKPMKRSSSDTCLAKEAAVYLRHLEIKQEYQRRKLISYMLDTEIQVENVVQDLIKKDIAHEFIEANGGAHFWGGHFYMQTVAEIVDVPMADMWEYIGKLEQKKLVSIEGAVVQSYKEPKSPTWEPYSKYEYNGWQVAVSLPTHSKMPQTWKFEVLESTVEHTDIDIPDLLLNHEPIFGPDEDDVIRAHKYLEDIIQNLGSK